LRVLRQMGNRLRITIEIHEGAVAELSNLRKLRAELRELDMSLYEQEVDCDWTSGSFMLARREALESAGYLDERFFDPPLLPRLLVKSDKVGDRVLFRRARSRALAEVINSGIQPLQNLSTTKAVKKLGGDDAEWVRPWIAIGLNSYAKLAAETAGVYSVGDVPTIADCCLIPQLASARRFGVDYSHHELLVRIEKMCLSLQAFIAAAPENQPDAVKTS